MSRSLPAAMAAALLVVACGDVTTPDEPPPPPRWQLRAGDTLLDHLDRALVHGYPATSLPPHISELALAPLRRRSPLVLRVKWNRVRAIPPEVASFVDALGDVTLWRAASPLVSLPDVGPPRVVVDGEEQAAWSPESSDPFPGQFVWWSQSAGCLLAVAPEAPRGVAVDAWVDPRAEFGALERGTLLRDSLPTSTDLAATFSLDDVTRPCVLLPPPGCLEWEVDELLADRLHVTFGVINRAWDVVDDVARRKGFLSDGVTFAVNVVARPQADGATEGADAASGDGGPAGDASRSGDGGSVGDASGSGDGPAGAGGASSDATTPPGPPPPAVLHRAWSATLTREEIGRRWFEATVDLSPWRGQSVRIELVTEAGPRGDPFFDYAVWSDLRLRGWHEREPDRPHVVLIDIDTLRADRLGCYGSERPTSPRIDAWAAERATVYTDAVATASWTLPSTVSMFTGLAVHQHGVDRATDAMGREAQTLVTRLRDAGYETRGVGAGGYLRPTFGFDVGFDVYETREPRDMDWSGALRALETADSERPLFLFLHTYFVHAPYLHDPRFVDPQYDGPFAGQDVDYENLIDPYRLGQLELDDDDKAYVSDLYDGAVARMDEVVGEFLAELNARVDPSRLLVILTSDHGEAFFEHDVLAHGQALYEEMLQVPMIVQFPGGAPDRVDAPVSTLDIVPTVLAAAGIEVPPELPGRVLTSEPGATVRVAQHHHTMRSIQSDGYKLIESLPDESERGLDELAPTRVELYHLAEDPQEAVDLAEREPGPIDRLRRARDWFLNEYPPSADTQATMSDMDAEDIEQLRALGYLGDG